MKNKMDLVDRTSSSRNLKVESSKDPLMQAANQVSAATREAAAPVIPEQKTLLDIANNIAAEMVRKRNHLFSIFSTSGF